MSRLLCRRQGAFQCLADGALRRRAALGVDGQTAGQIFGSPDDLKLRSCATLFAQVSPPGAVFERLLAKYFEGERDARTLELLEVA